MNAREQTPKQGFSTGSPVGMRGKTPTGKLLSPSAESNGHSHNPTETTTSRGAADVARVTIPFTFGPSGSTTTTTNGSGVRMLAANRDKQKSTSPDRHRHCQEAYQRYVKEEPSHNLHVSDEKHKEDIDEEIDVYDRSMNNKDVLTHRAQLVQKCQENLSTLSVQLYHSQENEKKLNEQVVAMQGELALYRVQQYLSPSPSSSRRVGFASSLSPFNANTGTIYSAMKGEKGEKNLQEFEEKRPVVEKNNIGVSMESREQEGEKSTKKKDDIHPSTTGSVDHAQQKEGEGEEMRHRQLPYQDMLAAFLKQSLSDKHKMELNVLSIQEERNREKIDMVAVQEFNTGLFQFLVVLEGLRAAEERVEVPGKVEGVVMEKEGKSETAVMMPMRNITSENEKHDNNDENKAILSSTPPLENTLAYRRDNEPRTVTTSDAPAQRSIGGTPPPPPPKASPLSAPEGRKEKKVMAPAFNDEPHIMYIGTQPSVQTIGTEGPHHLPRSFQHREEQSTSGIGTTPRGMTLATTTSWCPNCNQPFTLHQHCSSTPSATASISVLADNSYEGINADSSLQVHNPTADIHGGGDGCSATQQGGQGQRSSLSYSTPPPPVATTTAAPGYAESSVPYRRYSNDIALPSRRASDQQQQGASTPIPSSSHAKSASSSFPSRYAGVTSPSANFIASQSEIKTQKAFVDYLQGVVEQHQKTIRALEEENKNIEESYRLDKEKMLSSLAEKDRTIAEQSSELSMCRIRLKRLGEQCRALTIKGSEMLVQGEQKRERN